MWALKTSEVTPWLFSSLLRGMGKGTDSSANGHRDVLKIREKTGRSENIPWFMVIILTTKSKNGSSNATE